MRMIVSYLKNSWFGLKEFPWRMAARSLRMRFAEDRLGQTAGALTFTTTIALVPLVTVTLAVVTAFPIFDQFQNVLQRWLVESLIPDSIARQVLGYMTQFTSKASRLGSVSFAALLFSALALIFTIDRSFNAIWRVRKLRPLPQRVLLYWAVLTLGPLMLTAGLVTMASVISWSGGSLRSQGPGMKLALDGLEFALLWIGITCLYRFVPNTHVPWRQVLGGSLATTLVLEAARAMLTWYLGNMSTFSLVYGAFATVPILLIWIYMNWVIVLLGAVLVASWPSLMMGALRHSSAPGWHFQLATEVLKLLGEARQTSGHGLDSLSLSKQLQVDPLQLEVVLENLQALDWVGLLNEEQPGRAPRYVLLAGTTGP
jgi:membrane protein